MKLNKENLLKYVHQEEIFERYLGISVELGKKYINPFRDDKTPDCSFYYSASQILYFIDFACRDCGGDCWNIVQQYYSCDYYNALRHVNKDFGIGLDDGHIGEPIIKLRTKQLEPRIVEYKEKVYSDIRILTMPFTQIDLDYWNQYEITESQLNKFEVFSCFKSWIDNRFYYQWTKKEPQYAYQFDEKTFQIYRPYSKDKWRTNTSFSYLHGCGQLKPVGDLLIWSKSRKDLMCLDLCGYNSVAVPSEGTIPEVELVKELKQRFTNHIVLYDNDEPGRKYSDKFSQMIGAKQLFMPEGTKDPSDFVKEYSLKELKTYLDDRIRI